MDTATLNLVCENGYWFAIPIKSNIQKLQNARIKIPFFFFFGDVVLILFGDV